MGGEDGGLGGEDGGSGGPGERECRAHQGAQLQRELAGECGPKKGSARLVLIVFNWGRHQRVLLLTEKSRKKTMMLEK